MESWLSSFIGTVVLLAVAAGCTSLTYLVTDRIRAQSSTDDGDPIRRIAVNSAVPIASQLLIRGIDLATAIALLRILGPSGNGRYALAVVAWLYVKTISDFGLSLLATREIARDRSSVGRIVGSTTLFRLGILAVSMVPAGAYLLSGLTTGSIATETALAIGLLLVSIVPSSYTEAVNSALNGLERMSVAAVLNVGVSVVRAPLAVAAAANLDVPGVALAAVATSLLSADLYRRTLAAHGARTEWSLSRPQARWLAKESWPLLVNALLVSLFFRVDVFIIQAFKGDRVLGLYDAAYKLINLVTIIPAYATLALFPAMTVRAGDPEALARVQRLASRLLVWIAWGVVVVVCSASDLAIRVLAGDAYLPESAQLLRILIWFAPLSFLNGIAQYVLVAAGEQRRLAPVFLAAVVFNLSANLALVPTWGATASATITVATEVVILAALFVATRNASVPAFNRQSLGGLPGPVAVGVPSAILALWLATQYDAVVTVPVAATCFIAMTAILRVFGPRERAILMRVLRRSELTGERASHPSGANLP